MRRLPLVLLALSVPGFAQDVTDAGIADEGDGGTVVVAAADGGAVVVPPAEPAVERTGRHFAFTWDSIGPKPGQTDVQLWMTPRWGRQDQVALVDLRAGVLIGLPNDWAAGVFLDATPAVKDITLDSSIEARLTAHVQTRSRVQDWFSYGVQVEAGAGEKGFALQLLLAADRDLGAFRIAANLDGFTSTAWSDGASQAFTTARTRQTLGLSYTLNNGVSVGLEAQNRLSWVRGEYQGDAFLLGPSVSYRGSRFWWAVAFLPQVTAAKPYWRAGIGDPLELLDNERFTLRISAGVLAN